MKYKTGHCDVSWLRSVLLTAFLTRPNMCCFAWVHFSWKLPRAAKATAKNNTRWQRERSNCVKESQGRRTKEGIKLTGKLWKTLKVLCGVGREISAPHAWGISCIFTRSSFPLQSFPNHSALKYFWMLFCSQKFILILFNCHCVPVWFVSPSFRKWQ